jgi:hypothetical protein
VLPSFGLSNMQLGLACAVALGLLGAVHFSSGELLHWDFLFPLLCMRYLNGILCINAYYCDLAGILLKMIGRRGNVILKMIL